METTERGKPGSMIEQSQFYFCTSNALPPNVKSTTQRPEVTLTQEAEEVTGALRLALTLGRKHGC